MRAIDNPPRAITRDGDAPTAHLQPTSTLLFHFLPPRRNLACSVAVISASASGEDLVMRRSMLINEMGVRLPIIEGTTLLCACCSARTQRPNLDLRDRVKSLQRSVDPLS